MKRFRYEEQREMDNINMANVLLLLAAGSTEDHTSAQTPPPLVFECKTCSRRFSSFQALGGHRAGHRKPRHDDSAGKLALVKQKVHECSVCGLEFAIGQALGGHMRRHKSNPKGIGRHDVVEKKSGGGKRVLWLDLNLPPLDESEERLKLGLGLGPDIVDCFH